MAINKIITLTEKGLNAGPDYSVYYSTDCTNYTLATASIYLPEVGSSGSVSVADNTQCIKLINLSPDCANNEVIFDFRATTTTTIAPPPPFTTTTTTQAPGTTTTTTTTQGPLPTTTTYGPAVKVVAHACQNFSDFNTYRVPASPSPQIGGVYIDAYGTCYYITSIPTNQGVPGVGDLTFVGADGACSSSSCVTTTTTAAPYCNQWQVSNATGAGYSFKYYYCGQTQATYLEVPAGQSVIVCTQNDRIYNSFGAPLTFTNLSTSCIGTTTTTTQAPDLWRVVAHACQDFYDFNTYGVNKNLTPTVNIGDVFKDSFGTCYYVTSIPSDQTLPVVGVLSFVGGSGACSSSACVTTTTTQAPFCNTWKVENLNNFGQYFKYQYCGQTSFIYPEVPANSSVTVCVQNNNIFNSFSSSLAFTNLSTVCNATTTTTTTIPPQRIFRAAPCQNVANFNTYTANSSSLLTLGAVMQDDFGTCYEILSFSGTTPVGSLTYLGPAGTCTSASCVTTTTTLSPFCNLWQVENPFGSSYSFKYKYCGQTDFIYPSVAPFSSASFCVQNNEIYNAFGAPLIFTNLSGSCQATTTTTTTTASPTTTTTTTRAPYCAIFNVTNGFGAGYNISYVYCGQTSAQFVEIPPFTTRTFCVQNAQISNLGNPLVITETTSSCNATTTTTTTTAAPTTTTTTTRAPYCSIWNAQNLFGAGYTIRYTYCGATGSTFVEIPANTTLQLCVQTAQIDTLGAPIVLTETTASCVSTTTTTAGPTTTTTTTLAPGCWIYNAENTGAGSANVNYINCDGTGSVISVPSNESRQVCVLNAQISSSYAPMVITRTDISCAGGTTTTTTTTTTTAAPTTTTTTTTTIAPIGNQKIRMTDCDSETLDVLITVAVNGTPLLVNDVITFTVNFAGIDCWKVTNANATGTAIYDRALANRFVDCATCVSSGGTTTTTTSGPTTTTTIAQQPIAGNTYTITYPYSGSQYTSDTAYYADCNNTIQTVTAPFPVTRNFCSVWSLLQLQEWNPDADIGWYGPGELCCFTPTTTIPPPNEANCLVSASIIVSESPDFPGRAFFTINNCTDGDANLYSFLVPSGTGSYTLTECYISGSILSAYGSSVNIISSGSSVCNVWPNTTTTTSTTTTTIAPTSEKSAEMHFYSTQFGLPKTVNYTYNNLSSSITLTQAFKTYNACADITSSQTILGYSTSNVFLSTLPFFCSSSFKAHHIDVTNVYPFNDIPSESVMYFNYVNENGTLVNDSLAYTESKSIVSQVASFGQQRPISFATQGLSWIVRGQYTGSVTPYPYLNTNATYTITAKKLNNGSATATLGFSRELNNSGSLNIVGGVPVGYTASVVSNGVPSYYNDTFSVNWNMWISVQATTTTTTIGPTTTTTSTTTTTTTTTAGPTTTTTSTTTTTTTTTAGPTTTTTTAAPLIPSGAYAIYDFGNVTSYPGSGSTVFDISGNSVNGTLVNSPTFSSTFGGELRLDNASSQRIDYSATFTADTSTVIIWKNVDATFSKDTGVPTLRGNNGYMAIFLGGTKDFLPVLFNSAGSGNTYFGADVTPSDITEWHQYGQVVTYSSPNTTATNYLDGNASSATETKNFDRSGTGTGTAYIGFDNAVSDRYANGFIMAYLHYNRALTTTELNNIYSYFSARF